MLVAVVFVVVIAGLSIVGAAVNSNWETFIPDLINGIIGAGLIAGIIAWLQHNSEVKRAAADKMTSAYENLLDAIAPLRTLDMSLPGEAKLFSVLNNRMIQLTECVGADEHAMGRWFEAERQLGLHHALTCSEAVQAAGEITGDKHLEIMAPFLQWTTEFGRNVRFWRTGKLETSEMNEQARLIETGLRAKGVWREKEMPWRD